MSEVQKHKAKRITEILQGYGVLDDHYKIVIQTKESWIRVLTKAIVQVKIEELKKEKIKPKFKVDDRVKIISFNEEGRIWRIYKGLYEGQILYDIVLNGSRNLIFATEDDLKRVD